jgi:hypothetical protein
VTSGLIASAGVAAMFIGPFGMTGGAAALSAGLGGVSNAVS